MLKRCLPFLAVTVFLSACDPPNGVIVMGEQVKEPKKIISLSPTTTEILGSLLLDNVLVGKTSSCNYPPGIAGAIVVQGTKPNYEMIVNLKPDLIIYDAKLYAAADIDKLKVTGARLYRMDVNSLNDLQEFLLKFGSETGEATMASKTADEIYAAAEAARAAATGPKVRVAVVTGGGSSLYAAGKGSFLADVVKACGGEIVGPDGQKFAQVPVEQFIKEDPEMILTADAPGQLFADPRLSTVTAVRKKRVFSVKPDILLRTTARIKGLIANLSTLVGDVQREKAGS